jgi:NADH-quinone oxidoreductase subunit F
LIDYEKTGGYRSVRAALSMAPKDIVAEVAASRLRGRGGAGFPTGMKWQLVPPAASIPQPRYLVVNADEMEPGAFKDRLLLEGDPHQMIEGIIVSAYAVEAEHAVIFLRREYFLAEQLLRKAIAEAFEKNYLGKNILGSGFSIDIRIHTSAGRYICGEETALISALEGKRAMPRARPPFPLVCGLWGRPTIVNNVETVVNIPHIVNNGAEWFKSLSFCADGGTKIYGVTGRVNKPGSWELPLGTPIRDLMEQAGGMQAGYALRGTIPGGASTDFLLPEHLDTPMDFDSVARAGSRMGTGTMTVLDDRTCPVGFVHSIISFFARESCGWCTPCREGLPWIKKMLHAIENGQGEAEDIEVLEQQCRLLGPGNTFCAFAPGAVEPLQSALKCFRDDFEQHIRDKKCPWKGI